MRERVRKRNSLDESKYTKKEKEEGITLPTVRCSRPLGLELDPYRRKRRKVDDSPSVSDKVLPQVFPFVACRVQTMKFQISKRKREYPDESSEPILLKKRKGNSTLESMESNSVRVNPGCFVAAESRRLRRKFVSKAETFHLLIPTVIELPPPVLSEVNSSEAEACSLCSTASEGINLDLKLPSSQSEGEIPNFVSHDFPVESRPVEFGSCRSPNRTMNKSDGNGVFEGPSLAMEDGLWPLLADEATWTSYLSCMAPEAGSEDGKATDSSVETAVERSGGQSTFSIVGLQMFSRRTLVPSRSQMWSSGLTLIDPGGLPGPHRKNYADRNREFREGGQAGGRRYREQKCFILKVGERGRLREVLRRDWGSHPTDDGFSGGEEYLSTDSLPGKHSKTTLDYESCWDSMFLQAGWEMLTPGINGGCTNLGGIGRRWKVDVEKIPENQCGFVTTNQLLKGVVWVDFLQPTVLGSGEDTWKENNGKELTGSSGKNGNQRKIPRPRGFSFATRGKCPIDIRGMVLHYIYTARSPS